MKLNTWLKKAMLFVAALLLMCAFTAMTAGATEVDTHSKAEIINYLKSSGATTSYRHTFETDPVKYDTPGNLSDESKQSALKMLNSIRFVAGVNPVALDEGYGQKAQAGAFVDWAINILTHHPDQDGTQPEGMPNDVWELGIQGAGSSNIAHNQSTLNAAVLAWTEDDDAGNIPMIGHRRWTINPRMGKVGFGAAGPYYAEYSFDNSGSGTQTNVIWPARYMPTQFFGKYIPWSISTGTAETMSNIHVVLERTADSPSGYQKWEFDGASTYTASDTGKYFNVNNQGYGQTGCIIFRPDNVGGYKNGDVFNVTITGASQGTITYSVEFFNAYPVEAIAFAKDNYRLTGTTITLSPTVVPAQAEGYEKVYSSSDENVATVDNTGKVTKTGIGETTITVTVDGKYTADGNDLTASCTVKVPKPLNDSSITCSQERSAEYTGEVVFPKFTITDGDRLLEEGKDYSLELHPNYDGVEPGTHFVRAVGMGDYCGYSYGNSFYSYTINKCKLKEDMVTIDPAEVFVDGQHHKPAVMVKNHNTTLTEGEDYTLTNEGGAAVGAYPVVVTAVSGSAHYQGSVSMTFTITAKPVTAQMVGDIDPVTYSGQQQRPEPIVTDGSAVLQKDTDYELSYEDNINAGTAKVIITGKGNYKDTVEKTFTINKKALTQDMIIVSGRLTYNGQKQVPDVAVKDGSMTLTEDRDYTLVNAGGTNAGDYNVEVTGKGNYTGTVAGTYTIAPKTLTASMITLSADKLTYNGENQKPEVTVKDGGTNLRAGEDYTLTNAGGKNAGSYSVQAEGKGNYTGIASQPFTIGPKELEESMVVLSSVEFTYNGTVQKPEVTLKDGIVTLAAEDDYTLTNAGGKNAGSYYVTVTGKGNYTKSVDSEYTIKAASISEAAVSLAEGGQEYDGTAKTPAVTSVKLGTTELSAGSDYTVSYADNTAAGENARAIVTGKNNYTGQSIQTFAIAKKPIDANDIKVEDIPDQSLESGAVEPAVTVTFGQRVLAAGTDYELSYSDNDKEGTATVTVSGKGNFGSTRDKTFKIIDPVRMQDRQEAMTAINDAQTALQTAEQAAREAKTAADTAAASLQAANRAAGTPGQAAVTAAEKAASDAKAAAEKAAIAKQKAEEAVQAAGTAKEKADALVTKYGEEEQALADTAQGQTVSAGEAVTEATGLVTTAEQVKIDAGQAVSKAKTDKEAADKKSADNRARSVVTVVVNTATVNANSIDRAVAGAGGSKAYVKTIVLGSKVRKISKQAFKDYKKVTTLEVKTKKLKKKAVKGSLKGSAVKTVKIKIGKAKVNKTYVKKYKKIFTKKNAGKKVRVKK